MNNETHEYLKELTSEVKRHLPQYLSMKGHHVSRSNVFQCPYPGNHKHQDADFSATMSQNADGTYVWYCHVCKASGSIYEAAEALDNLPIRTQFTSTTLTLARELGIPIEDERFSPEDKQKYNDRETRTRMHLFIEQYLLTHGDPLTHLCTGRFGRSYTREEAALVTSWVGVGSVDAQELTDALRNEFGNAVEDLPFYMHEKQCLDQLVFGKDRLTLSIRDRYSTPQGFVGRVEDALLQGEVKVAKYKLTSGMEKKKILFMMDKAWGEIKRTKRCYIVEGQFDVISLRLKGIENVVGISGNGISQEAVDSLMNLKVVEVCFVLDNDLAGIRGLHHSLSLMKRATLSVTAVKLPSEFKDPDEMARAVDEPALILAHSDDALIFVLKNDPTFHNPDIPSESRYKNMISFASESTTLHAKLRSVSQAIGEFFPYSSEDIFNDLVNYSIGVHSLKSAEERKIWDQLLKSDVLPLEEKIVVLDHARNRLSKIMEKGGTNVQNYTYQSFLSLVRGEQKMPTLIKTGYPMIDDQTEIECGTINIWAGWPSNGKSTCLRHTIIQMLLNNPDLVVLYVSTDDQQRTSLIHFISLLTHISKSVLSEALRFGNFMDRPELTSHMDTIESYLNRRLCVVGLDRCSRVESVISHMDMIRTNHKRDLFVAVDAINNLEDMTTHNDQRVALETMISKFKHASVSYDASVNLVSHLVKQDGVEGRRPRLKSIKGSSMLEFEAKAIYLFHMDAHYKPNSALRWIHPRTGVPLPIIEWNIAKDKEKPANSIVPMKFDPLGGTLMHPPKGSNELNTIMGLIESDMRGGGNDNDQFGFSV